MALTEPSALLREVAPLLRPAPPLTHSEWADKYFYVTKGGSTGRWVTRYYQKEILDSWTDPLVWRTSFMKSARVGATVMLNIDEAYRLHYDPCDTCTVQPTTLYAQKYSRDTFNRIIENVPVIKELFAKSKWRDGTNSILEKYVNGASLIFHGANSPNGFRGWTYRVARADEVDGYPVMGAGAEGDQITLLLNRTIDYWDRLFIECSTPTLDEFSRIQKSFNQGDQRRRYLPCPHCGHMQFLRWKSKEKAGGFWWDKGNPNSVVYICESCERAIQHRDKWEMDRLGEWRPTAPANIAPDGREHRSYHIWAAYSYQANATWAHIVAAYEESKEDMLQYQTFVNTWLGEPWRDDAATRLTAEGLFSRREEYMSNTAPDGVMMITIGIDVQDDRIEALVWGWGCTNGAEGVAPEPEGWLISHTVIKGQYNDQEVWSQVQELIDDEWLLPNSVPLKAACVAVDSGDGDHAPYVYEFCGRNKKKSVIATKGVGTVGKPPIGPPRPVEYNWKGRPAKSGAFVHIVGTDGIKTRLMARLRYNDQPGDGYLHFPKDVSDEFFVQLVSERRSAIAGKWKWIRRPGARAETLDGTVYAIAALTHALQRYNKRTLWKQLQTEIDAKHALLKDGKSLDSVSVQSRMRRSFNVLNRQ